MGSMMLFKVSGIALNRMKNMREPLQDGQTRGAAGPGQVFPSSGCPLLARAPESGKREESYRVAAVPAARRPQPRPPQGAEEPPRAPSRGAGPRAPEGAPRAPEVCGFTPPRRPAGRAPRPRRRRRLGGPTQRAPAAGRPDRRNRCPAPLAEPPEPQADSTLPAALNGAFRRKGEAAEGGGGRTAGKQGAAAGPGAGAREEVSELGPQAAPLLASGQDSQGRPGPRGGGGPASTGEGVPAPRRSPPTPPAQPPDRDGVTRSRSAASPRPTRPPPPEPQYLQISPGQRLAPRPSAPSPSRGNRRHDRPAGPPPPPNRLPDRATLTGLPGRGGAKTRVAAPSRTTFLCCWSFGGGEGEGGKVGRWGSRGPRRPRRGAAESVQASGSRPAVPAAAAAAWGPGPRRRLLCSCAVSSREPHIPAQKAATRTRPAPPPPPPPLPGHAPSASRARPRDTPPPPPPRVAAWRAPPLDERGCSGPRLCWGRAKRWRSVISPDPQL
ncbi:basic proline-rich protein-like [Sagmatias obliquidens]|uniref:basic proline-rich protein-like n=1 Tax=Sagmatias obliquidens TaxID=3371155 RepID=UPI000F444C32|nr:basic proline-rich protein-like [Lagenorhynchus obliquidens]